MIVRWYPNAKADMRQIARYIQVRFGAKYCKEFLREVVRTEKLLVSSPNMGKVEPLLKNTTVTYRSFVVAQKSKIVYRIDGGIIIVVAFWDCRRDPDTLAAQVK